MRFELYTSTAKMPSSCKGGYHYRNAAVIAIEDGRKSPKIIRNTKHAKVIFHSGPGFDGLTTNCQHNRDQNIALKLIKWMEQNASDIPIDVIESFATRGLEVI